MGKKKENPKFLAAFRFQNFSRIQISSFHMPFPDGRIQIDDYTCLVRSCRQRRSERK